VSGAILDELLVLEVGNWELYTIPMAAGQKRPPARHSHVAGIFERDSVIVFGGAGLRGPLNDVWVYCTQSQLWRCLSEGLEVMACPEPREMAAGCVISDAGLFVHGGRGAEGEILSDVAIFDGRAGKWVLVQTTPYARCAHTATNAVQAQQPQAAQQPPPQQPAQQPEEQQPQQAVQQHQHQQEAQMAPDEGEGAQPGARPHAPPNPADAPSPPQPPQQGGYNESAGQGAGAGQGPGSAAASPVASNVLLYGGFTGEAVSGELLQLSFVRQSQAAGEEGSA
jgi:hypothetical protein